MKKQLLAVAMFAALFTAGTATAQEIKKDRQELSKVKAEKKEAMPKIDADNDGRISLAEAEKAPRGKMKENFAVIDTNKDSFLDKEELNAFREKRKLERAKKQK